MNLNVFFNFMQQIMVQDLTVVSMALIVSNLFDFFLPKNFHFLIFSDRNFFLQDFLSIFSQYV